jgi:cobyrinic acid a,c-diamide synthase
MSERTGVPGVVLGGTASGCGKTVAMLAVLRALRNACYDPQPAKAGPDFIDPSHHQVVPDRPSRTLDTWLQGEDGIRRNYHRGEGDICVVEGMMGLYDGDCTSTARVAESLSLPVVLVVDASAGMQSVGATALGFREYADIAGLDIEVVGVLAQRCHGGRHEGGVREALPDGIRYLGRIPPSEALEIPERHLGLHMGSESAITDDALRAAAEEIRTEPLIDIASIPPHPESGATSPPSTDATVAVARDEAFAFVYPATMERLREAVEVEVFSPVAGDSLPDCDGLYLPGGYPELFAAELADSPALSDISRAAGNGLPVLGECGGMMALTRSLTTADADPEEFPGETRPGTTYEMAGVLPADVEMQERYQALDHVELRATGERPGAPAGERLRGHEFHYSAASVDEDARFAFDIERGDGIDGNHDGVMAEQTVGTYTHVHPASGAFDRFLARL